MLNRRRLLTIIAATACLLVVSAASADPINTYTGVATPSHVKPSASASYSVSLTNDALSAEGADRAKIGIPPGFRRRRPERPGDDECCGCLPVLCLGRRRRSHCRREDQSQATGDQLERRAVRGRDADRRLHRHLGRRGRDVRMDERAPSRRRSIRAAGLSAGRAGGRLSAPGRDRLAACKPEQRRLAGLLVHDERARHTRVPTGRGSVRTLRFPEELHRSRGRLAYVRRQSDRSGGQLRPGKSQLDDRFRFAHDLDHEQAERPEQRQLPELRIHD